MYNFLTIIIRLFIEAADHDQLSSFTDEALRNVDITINVGAGTYDNSKDSMGMLIGEGFIPGPIFGRFMEISKLWGVPVFQCYNMGQACGKYFPVINMVPVGDDAACMTCYTIMCDERDIPVSERRVAGVDFADFLFMESNGQ